MNAPPPADRSWQDEILYFVMVDRFADGDEGNNLNIDPADKGMFHGGDLKGLTAQLDEIASLGATAIWITPVLKQIDGYVTGAGFPDWGYHGYWTDDFHRLDPRFGTEEDLKAFVDAAHARGIKVLLDVVYNHAGYGSRYTTDPATKDWLRTPDNGQCGADDLTSCLAGLPDFKTERPEIAKYLLDAQLGWAKRSGVDGFRLDTFKHLDHPFWAEHRRRVRAEVRPDFFLLGEVWGGDWQSLDDRFEKDEMDAGIEFPFQGTTVAFVSGRGRTVAYDNFLSKRHKIRPGYLTAHYLSSHDTRGALSQLGEDVELFKLAATLQLTTLGVPIIFYGEEVARKIDGWPDNRTNMPWSDPRVRPGAGAGVVPDQALRAYYRALISARKTHPALRRGTHRALQMADGLYVFAREDEASQDAVVVVINRGETQAEAEVPRPPLWGKGAAVDLLTGRELTGDPLVLTVPARTAMVIAARRGG